MLLGGYLVIRFLPKRAAGGLVLNERLRRLSPESPEEREGGTFETVPIPGLLQGARGTAITDLHPSGAMAIDDKRIDVVAEEGFIPRGTLVEVLVDEGYRRIVRAVAEEDAAADGQVSSPKPSQGTS
jgi:membrane-bound serine protease (ClpP class)